MQQEYDPSHLNRDVLSIIGGGLLRKVPLFLVALVAFVALVVLDRSKTNYDIENDNGAAAMIYVDDTFVKGLDGDAKAKKALEAGLEADKGLRPFEWLDNAAILKFRKFSNQRMLLDALADTATAKYSMELTESRTLDSRLDEAQAARDMLKAGSREWKLKEAEIKEFETKRAGLKGEKELKTRLANQFNAIYTEFKPTLPKLLLRNRRQGFLDNLLRPVLNESDSLHIVFQVFRISALIIIILTFIFIFIAGLQQLPIAMGSGTASEQLKSLISLKSTGGGGEIAKAAIIGVTALGVGTAVVVGGHGLESKPNVNLPGSSYTANGPSAEFTTNNSILNQYRPYPADLYQLLLLRVNNQPPVVEVNPNFEIPKPIVISRTTLVPSSNDAILEQLRILVTKLPASLEVSRLTGKIEALEKTIAALQQPTNCNCEAAIGRLKDSIDRIADSLGSPRPMTAPSPATSTPTTSPSTAPTSSPPTATPPTTAPVASPTATPTPSPTPKRDETLLGNLREATAAITAIESQLKASSEAQRLRSRPDGRSVVSRSADFIFGADYYAISPQAYEELKKIGIVNSTQKVVDGLEAMMRFPPQRKSSFLNSLRNVVTAAIPNGSTKKALLADLKNLEPTILDHAKLPN